MATIFHGGSGPKELGSFKCIHNASSTPLEVHYSYPTVGCGQADHIVCPPHGWIRKISKESARDFATWEILDEKAAMSRIGKNSDYGYLRWDGAKYETIWL